jgi:uncharacterized membrane protein YphA (DoxX/SURF4 family)
VESQTIGAGRGERETTLRPSRVLLVIDTLVRCLLGIIMVLYGLQKITDMQIQLSAWDYAQPLIRTPGMSLTWAFLGYQPWFQSLTGFLEAIPGLMLLSRRFWRLGALLLFPVVLNVVLINWAMDLWLDTRILSLVLLTLNVFLVCRNLPVCIAFLKNLTPRPASSRHPLGRMVSNAAFPVLAIMAIGGYFVLMNLTYVRAIGGEADFIGVRQINGAGTWIVQQAAVDGHEVAGGADRKIYFDAFGKCVFTAPGQELKGTFKSNLTNHTFRIAGVALSGDSSSIDGTYQVQGNQLILQGEQSHKPVQMTLKKWGWGPLLPFHS